MKHLGEAVRAARERSGQSQQSIASKAEISISTLRRIEAGENTTTELLERLGSILGFELQIKTVRRCATG
jgi:ribosome-binding protein aMBF1 (putative translation factor)